MSAEVLVQLGTKGTDTKDKVAKSIEIAGLLIKELKPMCLGAHIMPIGWDKKVPLVLDAVGL